MKFLYKYIIFLLIFNIKIIYSYKLNEGLILDLNINKFNKNNNTENNEEICLNTNNLLNYINEMKLDFPNFGFYINDLIKNCKKESVPEYKNNDLCNNKKLNDNFSSCCIGDYENKILDIAIEFECIVSSIGINNETNNNFIKNLNNTLDSEINIFLNAINNKLNNVININNTDFNPFNNTRIINSYRESKKLLEFIKEFMNEIFKMFIFGGNIMKTEEYFIKYLISILCGICDNRINKMIINTGNVKLLQIHPNSINNMKDLIDKNYRKFFEKLGLLENLIRNDIKKNIEIILNFHTEWITFLFYNKLKDSSYDMKGILDQDENIIMDLYKKNNLENNHETKKNIKIKNFQKLDSFTHIVSSNSIKNEINKIVKDNYLKDEWVNKIINCIYKIPIYNNENNDNNLLIIDKIKFNTYILASLSDPTGHGFISNFIIAPTLCLKSIIKGILRILPNPNNDYIAYKNIFDNQIINTENIAKKVIDLFRDNKIRDDDDNNIEYLINDINYNKFNIINKLDDKIDNKSEYNNQFLNNSRENMDYYQDRNNLKIKNIKKNYYKINNQIKNLFYIKNDDISKESNNSKNSFIIVSNENAIDVFEFSKSPPYSINLINNKDAFENNSFKFKFIFIYLCIGINIIINFI